GLPPDSTAVSMVMSTEVQTCHPDDSLEDIAAAMGLRQIRRMPVIGDDGALVGIVTLADIERLERGEQPA
ncbi:MAG TPA: CBS domain-containing protein, partial [Candidatus Omnitrophota bacterium]|nr:CBS domain-containing protein [Candidatus Omnitrophota bacterium]